MYIGHSNFPEKPGRRPIKEPPSGLSTAVILVAVIVVGLFYYFDQRVTPLDEAEKLVGRAAYAGTVTEVRGSNKRSDNYECTRFKVQGHPHTFETCEKIAQLGTNANKETIDGFHFRSYKDRVETILNSQTITVWFGQDTCIQANKPIIYLCRISQLAVDGKVMFSYHQQSSTGRGFIVFLVLIAVVLAIVIWDRKRFAS